MKIVDVDALLERVGRWEHNPDNTDLFLRLSDEIDKVIAEGGFDVPDEVGHAIEAYIESIDNEKDELEKRLHELVKERKAIEKFYSKHFRLEI